MGTPKLHLSSTYYDSDPKGFTCMDLFNPQNHVVDRFRDYPHFADEKNQRTERLSKNHTASDKLGFEPRQSSS